MKKIKELFKWLSLRFESLYFTVIWILVIVPFLSLLFITVSGESPLYTSISRIAWVGHHRIFMIIWSLVVLFPMVCMTNNVIKNSKLNNKRKSALYLIAIVNIIISFVAGVLVPAKSSANDINFWGILHDLLTAIGWLAYGVVLTIFSFSLFKVDKLHATISICFMFFLWCTGLFFIFYVIDENTYCGTSAVTQMYIINMLNIFLLINDIFQRKDEIQN